MKIRFVIAAAVLAAASAVAAPVKYTIDSNHTYPSFETDHFGGLSTWRGKFNKSSGTIVYDKDAGSGTLDITIDTASIDLGHDKLNEHVKSGDAGMLDVAKFPTATYTGKLAKFVNGAPTEVDGTLTLHGVSKPVTLKIDRFDCRPHPMQKGKEVCGANATAGFDRSDFGIDWGKTRGFDMGVKLAIQVEALTGG
ncbi:MAG TPA: YceI family protein [Steroidobacteraceae bacterium]|nr:YceI family protein [Steroidobacteraceae bacterium]